jgi:MSHA pilin protein MshA
MSKSQKGFTLIELVVVIVLLGILGVTALGKYQDLSVQAQTAVNEGVASELSSAAAINYAASVVGAAPDLVVTGAAFDCTTVGPLFATNAIPGGMSITGNVDCTAGAGTTGTCAVVDSAVPAVGASFNATLVCTQ